MKSEYILKYAKLVLCGIALVFITQILFTSEVRAQQVSGESRIELTEKISDIRSSIQNLRVVVSAANSVEPLEKIKLFQQLISLSDAINTLENKIISQDQRFSTALSEGVRLDKVVLPEDIGLVHIAIDLDFKNFAAIVTEYFSHSSSGEYEKNTRSLSLARNPDYAADDFLAQVPWAKDEVIKDVAEKRGFQFDSLASITSISSANPKLAKGTLTAKEFENQFGIFSRITDVFFTYNFEVRGGRDADFEREGTQISFLSDQGETYAIDIFSDGTGTYREIVNGKISDNASIERKYDITYTLSAAGSQKVEVVEEIQDVFHPDVLNYLEDFFVNLDFLNGIENGGDKLTSFLTENTGYLSTEGASGEVESAERRCVAGPDALVVRELLLTSIPLLGFQTSFDGVSVEFQSPVDHKTISRSEFKVNGCVDVSNHF